MQGYYSKSCVNIIQACIYAAIGYGAFKISFMRTFCCFTVNLFMSFSDVHRTRIIPV